ncbi:MAG TPA: peptidyl-prolyl cis-trans isomerase [Gemmatimonadaceae bacterium]|nr:peptidyl-prolyl cis-trans isomerase [Gemmatimonadaceae bacterium]
MLQQMRANAIYIWIIVAIAFVGVFLFADMSGLLGRGPVTTSSVVAKVDGENILYTTWVNTSAQMAQQQEQSQGRGLTLDERRQVDQQAFDELVNDILLRHEYDRRGIRVTDAEIVDMAKYSPPPQLQQMPDLQTDGRFDPAKYQRFLASPVAKQQGILLSLENFYRTEIPKQKLFAQVAGDLYVSDQRLWTIWQDTRDSATVSYVAFRPAPTKENRDAVTDAEIRAYYDSHKAPFDRPGTAVVSIMSIPRRPTAADTAQTLARIRAIRDEIAKGAKFDDVAKRESDDSVSAVKGGDLGRSVKGTYVKQFDDAVFSLPVGTLSQPIKTDFGFHLIRVDKRTGDTAYVHHILKLVKQGDSAATATDRLADQLAKATASATTADAFDKASKDLGLLISRVNVSEGETAIYLGRTIPSVSAWAFGGARPGESSDLFDDDAGYYVARLDSLHQGGQQPLETVKEEIRTIIARDKALDGSMTTARTLAQAAAKTSLEAAAKDAGRPVEKAGPFSRSTPVAAFGYLSEATGAAFALPVGKVGEPVRTSDAVFVLRVDKRTEADSAKWAAQKTIQRLQVQNSLRDQRVRAYLTNLRKAAKIDDHRAEINALQRRQSATGS